MWDLLNPERNELYHLTNDPMETTNLIDSSSTNIQQVIERLKTRILDRMETIDDPAAGLAGGPPFQGEVNRTPHCSAAQESNDNPAPSPQNCQPPPRPPSRSHNSPAAKIRRA